MKALFQNDTWQEIFGSIQKNRIRTIITMIGVLWGIFIYITLAGTSKGLDSYSSNGTVKRYLFKEFNENIIWKFIKDDNKIWICSENGLFQLQNDSLKSIIKDVRIFDAVKTDSTILFTSNKGLISLRDQNDYVILDKFKNEFIISRNLFHNVSSYISVKCRVSERAVFVPNHTYGYI